MLGVGHLDRVSWECIHFATPEEAALVRDRIVGETAVIEVKAPESGERLLAALARAFRFPDYFGNNWDALDECLADLEWLHAPGYVCFVTQASVLWQADVRAAGLLVESWLAAAGQWGERGVPFHLVFVL